MLNVTDFNEQVSEIPINSVVLALLDCSKAFDRMFRSLLLNKLREMGVTDRLFMFVTAYFYRCRQRVKVNANFSDYVKTPLGGPQGSVITLLCWLIYINDISAEICDSGCGLFVDDVCIWLASPNENLVVSRLNAELNRIYSWACLNKVVFDFKKVHLLDMGERLSPESKLSVRYGSGAPEWTDAAKYLGVILDNNLTFLPMIEEVGDKFHKSTWRIFNHSNLTSGASPRTLEIIFSSWLWPIVEYGSAIWIFRIKKHFHYCYPILSDYKDSFGRLERLYHLVTKAILGVDKSASNTAALVRLGWMPIDYRLAFHACIWYMKIRLGLAGSALKNQYARLSHISNDETWAKSGF